MQRRELRNCLAHYGLGQYMDENNIIRTDTQKGLTNKTLNLDYCEAKHYLDKYLYELRDQIQNVLLV